MYELRTCYHSSTSTQLLFQNEETSFCLSVLLDFCSAHLLPHPLLPGFKVIDERSGQEFAVAPENLVVVKSVDEYEAAHPGSPPQLVFGSMQMGQKLERWTMVKPGADGAKVTALTAANGIPYTSMLEALRPLGGAARTGHATAYVKARAEVSSPRAPLLFCRGCPLGHWAAACSSAPKAGNAAGLPAVTRPYFNSSSSGR